MNWSLFEKVGTKWAPSAVAIASVAFACVACDQATTANDVAAEANRIAEEATKAAKDANELAERALTEQQRLKERAAAERVTFTAAKQVDGNYRIVIDNLSIQRMNALQIENRADESKITAVYLRDQAHCARSYYIVSGTWWRARSMYLAFEDADDVAWARPWRGKVVKESAVDRTLPIDQKTYDINQTSRDQQRQVITRAQDSAELSAGCA